LIYVEEKKGEEEERIYSISLLSIIKEKENDMKFLFIIQLIIIYWKKFARKNFICFFL
jgi:hypothetical protein